MNQMTETERRKKFHKAMLKHMIGKEPEPEPDDDADDDDLAQYARYPTGPQPRKERFQKALSKAMAVPSPRTPQADPKPLPAGPRWVANPQTPREARQSILLAKMLGKPVAPRVRKLAAGKTHGGLCLDLHAARMSRTVPGQVVLARELSRGNRPTRAEISDIARKFSGRVPVFKAGEQITELTALAAEFDGQGRLELLGILDSAEPGILRGVSGVRFTLDPRDDTITELHLC